MICIYCSNQATQVINSRPLKRKAGVWRRRQCLSCHRIFTTDEAARTILSVRSDHSVSTDAPFSLGHLTVSIWRAFQHDPSEGQRVAGDLAATVESLLAESQQVTSTDIAKITYQVLQRYDASAAITYALQHHILTNVRRRGRPSIAALDDSGEPAPGKQA